MMKGMLRLCVFLSFLATLASGQECTADGTCDTHERCAAWKEEGECYKNEEYMKKHCPASCADEDYPTKYDKACKDHHLRCPVWASVGECEENPKNMKRYCPKSCGICKDDGLSNGAADNNISADDPLCVDEHEQCGFWASKGECSANAGFMHLKCAKSCGTCDINKKNAQSHAQPVVSSALSEDERKLVESTTDFGDLQVVSGAEAEKTLDVVRKTVDYMKNEARSLPDSTIDKCLNRNQLCSFWAAIGECDANQAFMLTNCAPSCKSCHLIDMDSRCPPIKDAVPALKPGSLNAMFERIVAEAPGNRTLSQAESKELADKQIPEYTVTVISRPSTSPTIEVSPILDRTLPPWILTFENFLTPEECKTLIGLGYEHGYERSRDVGDQKFDGSFDGKESVGRTSENAWCSAMKGCRDHDVVKRVMKRMSDVMGIPPENSEDLQLLKYEKGQFYNAHHDYIPHQRDRQCGPRILTFFLYLSDVEAGGGTKFNQLGHVVLPKAGKALLWPSVIDSDPTQADPRTTHEAMPVGEGTKFAANGWIHLYDYLGPQARGCN